MTPTSAARQQIIDVYTRYRQDGVLLTNEIKLRPEALRDVVLGLADLGVKCTLVTGWYPWPEPAEGKVYLVEDLAADFSLPKDIIDDVDAATRWALDCIDKGMGPQHIYVGSEFNFSDDIFDAIVEAWRALPGPTYPLPFDERGGAGHTSG